MATAFNLKQFVYDAGRHCSVHGNTGYNEQIKSQNNSSMKKAWKLLSGLKKLKEIKKKMLFIET